MQPDEEPLSPRELIYRAFLFTWIKNGWESRTSVSVADYFHPECVITGMAPVVLEGVDQVQAAYQSLHARVDHCHAEVNFMLIREESFSLVMELQGIHRDTGMDIVIEVGVHGRLKDDLVFQCHNVVDYTSMYAKLGILDVEKLRDELG
ncbi:nuclear transport factor 2 family protein [Rubripirellula reticaptiva]|uniref:SnoaL-like domain-containing protein n=1 Tax=Rubripirellula reticaptiva TaxID=2528013 RepID=A0A5C6EI70_9BACT|nr:nuclear transport factor 2 family protein [Rubripirellula reticaptiva]TWU48194.1 hypothetical protein Poly59_50400 [Rubripirellula reticaptiva]